MNVDHIGRFAFFKLSISDPIIVSITSTLDDLPVLFSFAITHFNEPQTIRLENSVHLVEGCDLVGWGQ